MNCRCGIGIGFDRGERSDPPHWVGIDAWASAICFNTAEGQPHGLTAPTNWKDLIQPEYKGMIVMNGGQVEQVGTPEDIYTRPATRFVAEFLGDTNTMDGIALPDGHVRIGRAELRAGNAGTAHAGDRVTLCIRPSDIALGRAGKAGLEASVRAMEFRGGHYKATLFVDTLETTLQADVSRAQRDALHLAVATPITVNLPEERAVLFVK